MASIITTKSGLRQIRFHCPQTGKRKTIRLGRITLEFAKDLLWIVQRLVDAKRTGNGIGRVLADRLQEIPDDIHRRIARVGLLSERETTCLGKYLDEFIERRQDVKKSTKLVYGHTKRCLIEYFGSDRGLRDVTSGDAEEWRRWLGYHEKLGDNTIRRRTGIARQFFTAAVKKKMLDSNPFEGLSARVHGDPDKFFFVDESTAKAVLDACPSAEWRCLFALARYGGLRIPSESLELTWDDVNWEAGKITVRSPKTARHAGKEQRVIPLFTELRPYLQDALALADDNAKYVITRYRDNGVNLRTQLLRILARAGVKPWPKLWHNLRATRQTELADRFPEHVVCGWVGNSPEVAKEHYLRITDSHFAAASHDAEAHQKAHHQQATTSNNEQSQESKKRKKTRENEGDGVACDSLTTDGIVLEGLELSCKNPEETRNVDSGAPPYAPELAELMSGWAEISPAAKERILAMLQFEVRQATDLDDRVDAWTETR